MKAQDHFFLAVCCVILCACAATTGSVATEGTPEAAVDNGLAPLTIADSQLHYRDNHGSYIYTFFADGRYRFASLHQSGTWADSREGRYRYTITAPGEATLNFQKEPAMRLRFKNPLNGTGTTDGDVRPFAFTMTRPDGE